MFPVNPKYGDVFCDEAGQWWEWDGEWYRVWYTADL